MTIRFANQSFNPFDLSEDEIKSMVGDTTPQELRCIKAVLNGVKAKLHNANMISGMTHADGCWSWGPAHYMCAYNRLVAINHTRPAMTHAEIVDVSKELEIHFDDVEQVVHAVEKHHLIGGTR